MAYQPPKKKKSIWDSIQDTAGGFVDQVLPGNQSSWRSATTRSNNAIDKQQKSQSTPIVVNQSWQQPQTMPEQSRQTGILVEQPPESRFGKRPSFEAEEGPVAGAVIPFVKPKSNLQKVGGFIKDAAIDVKDTTVGAYQGVGSIARAEIASNNVDKKTAERNQNTKAWSAYMNTLKPEDYKSPAVQAKLTEFKNRNAGIKVSDNTRQDLKEAQEVDAKKLAFQSGETFLNVATLGIGTGVKQIAKQGVKQGIKSTMQKFAEQGVKKEMRNEAILGAGFGVTNTGRNDEDNNAGVSEYLKNAGIGAVIGGAVPVAVAGAGKVIGAGKNKVQSFFDKAIPEEAAPPRSMPSENLDELNRLNKKAKEEILTLDEKQTRTNLQIQKDTITTQAPPKINAEISEDLNSVPNIKKDIREEPIDNLKVGSDAIGDVDPAQVENYKQRIQNGEPIDPIVITKEKDGTFVQDGKHRVLAAQQLGIKNIPTVEKVAPVEAPTTVKVNNLGLDVDPRLRFATRSTEAPDSRVPVEQQTERTRSEQIGQIAKMSDDDFVSQMVNDLGIDEAAARTMLTKSNKPALFNTLYGRKDAIRSANNPTGYAMKIVNDSTAAGQAALNQNAPARVAVTNGDTPEPMTEWTDEFNGVDPRLQQVIKQTEPTPARPDPVPPTPPPVDPPVTPPPVRDTPQVEPPPVKETPPPSRLGSIVDDFYLSKKGNQRINYNDLKRLGETVSKQIDDDFKAIGSNYNDVAIKVQIGANKGIKKLEDAGLTPDEANIIRNAQSEMNYVRRKAALGNKEVSPGDFGEMYLPRQVEGQYSGGNLFDGFRNVKPGNEFKRKKGDAGLQVDQLDNSSNTIAEYVTRYGDTKLYQQERLARALAKNNPDATPEMLANASQKLINIQERVNSVKVKIGAFGFGTRKQVNENGFVDTAQELADLGLSLGHGLDVVTDRPKGLTNGDRINSVTVGGKNLGDKLGLNQHRDAQSFASSQFAEAGGDRMKLAQSVYERLSRDYDLLPEDVEAIATRISRIGADVPDELVTAQVQSAYRNAAKQQLLEQLQNIEIANPRLRKDVSELTNQILREGSMERELSAKVVSKVLQTQNAIFRKLNISSAINELSDLNSFISVYGKNTALTPDFNNVKQFGLGEIDPAIEPYLKAVSNGSSFMDVAKTINNATNLYKFVEHYKAAVVSTSAKNFYSAQGIVGDELTKKVLEDYRRLALPVDAFTKTFLDNMPLYTQYLTWGLRNLQKEGRLATGKIDAGVLSDMGTKQRIARNAYANLPAKTVFWLSSNALKGTAILSAFGLTDFTGMTNGDFSGIAEEDKSWFDKTTQYTNTSTTMSMLNSVVQSWEKDQLKNSEKYKNADYNPYENSNLKDDVLNKFTPQIVKNIEGANKLNKDGYSENKSGRVQYEAPDDLYNKTKSYVFGKGQTDKAREYSGRESVLTRDGNVVKRVTDMAKEQLGIKEGDYNRPLTETYSEAYKARDKAGRTALLQGGRQFNDYLDNLKKDKPDDYNRYIATMDGNHVDPEYWKSISQKSDGTQDLAVFEMTANRKKQLFKDLGTAYDPLYDLPKDQAASVLQLKSTATGDDLALRNVLNKEGWYKDFKLKTSEYYKDLPDSAGGDFKKTDRVIAWDKLDDELSSYYYDAEDKEAPVWAEKFPLVYQQKAINAKFGFESQESKDFFKANSDGYKAEKENFDKDQLAIINKMRKIEGYPEMGFEAYKQATNVADTDGSSKKYGSGSGSSTKGIGVTKGDFGSAVGPANIKVTTKAKKIKIKPQGSGNKKITMKMTKTV